MAESNNYENYAKIAAFILGGALVSGAVVESYQESKKEKNEFKNALRDTELSLSRARLAYLSGGINISGTALLQEEYVLDNLYTERRLARKMLNYRTINRVLAASVDGITQAYKSGAFGFNNDKKKKNKSLV